MILLVMPVLLLLFENLVLLFYYRCSLLVLLLPLPVKRTVAVDSGMVRSRGVRVASHKNLMCV